MAVDRKRNVENGNYEVDQVFQFPQDDRSLADMLMKELSCLSRSLTTGNPASKTEGSCPNLSNRTNPSTCSSQSSSSPACDFSAFTGKPCSRSGSPGSSTVTSSSSSYSSARTHSSLPREAYEEKVKVFVRMRPFNENEKVCPLKQVLCLLGNKVVAREHIPHQHSRGSFGKEFSQLEFKVDYVQDDSYVQVERREKKEESQLCMYDNVGVPTVKNALNGQNMTVLVYGQANTGKTYTMSGDGTHEGRGLMPRLACDLMQHVKEQCINGQCTIQVSYLEIYQEKVRDLLAAGQLFTDAAIDFSSKTPDSSSNSDKDAAIANNGSEEEMYSVDSDYETFATISQQDTMETGNTEDDENFYRQAANHSVNHVSAFTFGVPSKSLRTEFLRVREHPVTGTYVEGLLWKEVATWSEMERLLKQGAASRTTAVTDTNRHSSQSHTLFTIKITWISRTGIPRTCGTSINYINLVDLAGSEKLQSVSGERHQELKYINKSLSQLNSVILSLSKSTFVSYRNSALTRLLKGSLGGNSKTFLVANISPAEKETSKFW